MVLFHKMTEIPGKKIRYTALPLDLSDSSDNQDSSDTQDSSGTQDSLDYTDLVLNLE